ncbi:hypothetical protein Mal52_00380 [Symmachiella dynata]|uniref:Lipoprotein n=1 Tax=Symmachiella dynata TaxID=2527995 RepID=A0A517ZGH9_9PLAN|nr:hypothetical protein [Symmachiella dynata]QDU41585.1 hypothetical protein Mal52_00380 [Symmachiella dynata]
MLFRIQVVACCLMMTAGCGAQSPEAKALPSAKREVSTTREKNDQPKNGEDGKPHAAEEAAVLKNGMLLEEALDLLNSVGVDPTLYEPAIDVKGAVEWKMFLLGVRGNDEFFLLATRTAGEEDLRIHDMYWYINGVNDRRLAKGARKHVHQKVSEISLSELVDELSIQVP